MRIRRRITRSFIKKQKPCEYYLPNNKKATYNYMDLIPVGGLSMKEFLALPIPFVDKIWALDFCRSGFLREVLSSEEFEEFKYQFTGRTYRSIWEACHKQILKCSTELSRGRKSLPTKDDKKLAEKILDIIARLPQKGLKKKGWKICYSEDGVHFFSSFVPIRTEYKLGEFVEPFPNFGPLCIYRIRKHAIEFLEHVDPELLPYLFLFKCEYEDVDYSETDCVWDFKFGKQRHLKDLDDLLENTELAWKVKLIEQVNYKELVEKLRDSLK